MRIPVLFDQSGAHIPLAGDPLASPVTGSPEQLAAAVRAAQARLRAAPLDHIIGICDAAGEAWVQPGNPVAKTLSSHALGFLPLWLRRGNLESICDAALRGNRAANDGFVPINAHDKRLHRAQPRGLVVHWLAGNVPLLGMISVVQGLLAKNANLLKVSRQNAGMLPYFLDALRQVQYKLPSGEVIAGSLLTDAVCAVYSPSDHLEAARALSLLADIRVAWGGREAVEAIMNLPRRFGTEDIIFGPKLSFEVVGAEVLADEKTARTIATRVAQDTVALEQRGCNSPHTVFVERGGSIAPTAFAALLAGELGSLAARVPLAAVSPQESFQVLGFRAEYDMRGEAWYGDTVSWTVLYSEDDRGLASPCYVRTLSVRPVDDIFEVVPFCSVNTQSAGLAVTDRRLALADALTAHGVERCPKPGSMSLYDLPWDGMYPIDRMVRWVSA